MRYFENDERRVGPVVLLLPILMLLLGIVLVRDRIGARGERPPAPEVESERTVQGWGGLLELEGGARLSCRLTPLHGQPERQGADARALAARLDLPPGQPWRLLLQHQPAAYGGAPEVDFEIDRVRLVDDDGVALRPAVEAHPAPAANDVADPLRVLLAPPREALGTGEALHIVLWGRKPADGARVEGLVSGERAVPGLLLQPLEVRLSEVQASLAWLVRTEERDARPERRSSQR